jgi:hypothetical protein
MDDTENLGGYSPPSFSSEGFGENLPPKTETEEEGQTIDAEYTEASPTNRKDRKKRTPSNRRLEELIYERGTLEQQNNFLAQQAAQQAAEKAALLEKLQQYEAAMAKQAEERNEHYEEVLDSQEDALLQAIKRAKEDGDIDAEVKLINNLADVKARKTTNEYDLYQKRYQAKLREESIKDEPYVPIETFAQPQKQERLPEVFQDWLEDNSWYESNPKLRQEADTFAEDYANRLSFNNLGHLIGSPEFYENISKVMNDRYGSKSNPSDEGYNEQPDDTNYSTYENRHQPEYPVQASPYASQTPVAPVTRRGLNMADQYVQTQRNTQGPLRALTKEEFAIARHLQVRNRGEGEADLVKRFAQAKNYPKSPLPGGSPHRLTII